MKNKYLTIGLSLTILVAVMGADLAHAQGSGTVSKTPMEKGNPIQSQNKRQKTLHSVRKAAAARLKKKHKIERTEKMAEYVREHGDKGGSK
ncbi:MAG: hypothetical protein LUQ11_10860 [Methylococcaceae bacterium]|nr:hypothetical protein [Methylococcaceae bacterium]